MKNRSFQILALVLVILLMSSAPTVYADGIPGEVYVDINYIGTEDGTQSHPYNTPQEGKAFAQTQSGGAWIYLKQTDGTWSKSEYVKSAVLGATGVPLTNVVIYTALAVLALILILIGAKLQHRSRQLRR